MDYLREGLSIFIKSIPISIIIFAIGYGVKYLFCCLLKRKAIIHISIALSEFLWILTIVAILKITGIIGGNFKTTSLFTGTAVIDFSLFREGLSMATILNFILFMPFGFFVPLIFKRLKNKWFYGILFGFIFSLSIEFLQTFTGRFVQIEDILMNIFGTFIGYELSILLVKRKNNLNYICSLNNKDN